MRISPLDIVDYDDDNDDNFDNRCQLWWPDVARDQRTIVTTTVKLLVRRGVICEENGD